MNAHEQEIFDGLLDALKTMIWLWETPGDFSDREKVEAHADACYAVDEAKGLLAALEQKAATLKQRKES